MSRDTADVRSNAAHKAAAIALFRGQIAKMAKDGDVTVAMMSARTGKTASAVAFALRAMGLEAADPYGRLSVATAREARRTRRAGEMSAMLDKIAKARRDQADLTRLVRSLNDLGVCFGDEWTGALNAAEIAERALSHLLMRYADHKDPLPSLCRAMGAK